MPWERASFCFRLNYLLLKDYNKVGTCKSMVSALTTHNLFIVNVVTASTQPILFLTDRPMSRYRASRLIQLRNLKFPVRKESTDQLSDGK